MGRKTYFSIPEKFRPLPGRLNVIITRNRSSIKFTKKEEEGVEVFESYPQAINSLKHLSHLETIFVTGGAEIYKEALAHRDAFGLETVDRIYWTKVHHNFECDTFVEPVNTTVYGVNSTLCQPKIQEKDVEYEIVVYDRKPKSSLMFVGTGTSEGGKEHF